MNDRNESGKPSVPPAKPSGDTNGYAPYPIPPEEIPNIDDLVIDDHEPFDNIFVERQSGLLVSPLYTSWNPEGRTFLATAHVGLFYHAKKPPMVPDFMLSLDVPVVRDFKKKENRSYFTWIVGKPPDVTIEIVSDRRGDEEGLKKGKYAKIGVRYYVIFDPDNLLDGGVLRVFDLVRGAYRNIKPAWLPRVGLGLTLWRGEYRGTNQTWLRWCDRRGVLIAAGNERAEQADQRAEQERQRAEQERQRAEQLAAQLRALGIEPKS